MSRSPRTMSVPQAGKLYFGLGRAAAYAAARRGEIPTVRIGQRLRAVVDGCERILEEAGRTRNPERAETVA